MLGLDALPREIGDGEVGLTGVDRLVCRGPEGHRGELAGAAVVSDHLLEGLLLARVAETGVCLPVEVLRARDVAAVGADTDAGGPLLQRREHGDGVRARCPREGRRIVGADTELGVACVHDGVHGGVVVRQDLDIESGFLEPAALLRHEQSRVVGVRGPVERESDGAVRTGARTARGDRRRRDDRGGEHREEAARAGAHAAGHGCGFSAVSQNRSSNRVATVNAVAIAARSRSPACTAASSTSSLAREADSWNSGAS